MPNILYGVNGEGAGHSSRAREVIAHLESQGHRVHVASFDRGYRNLKDDFDVTEIDGLRLADVHNRVRYRKTVLRNLLHLPQTTRMVRFLEREAGSWDLDMVITDYDPITCHVAHRLRLPVIGIDNQHLLTDTEITYPREYRRDAAAAKLVTRLMTPHADAYLVISFFTAPVKKRNTFLFPPLLRQEILAATPSVGEHVLVYVTSPAPALAKVLSSVRGRLIAYGFGREGEDGNILYRTPSLDGFMRDLTSASALVANAGFSLVTEALHLGKPYLAVPVSHQFEQIFNAYWLGKAGYGADWEDF